MFVMNEVCLKTRERERGHRDPYAAVNTYKHLCHPQQLEKAQAAVATDLGLRERLSVGTWQWTLQEFSLGRRRLSQDWGSKDLGMVVSVELIITDRRQSLFLKLLDCPGYILPASTRLLCLW